MHNIKKSGKSAVMGALQKKHDMCPHPEKLSELFACCKILTQLIFGHGTEVHQIPLPLVINLHTTKGHDD